MNTSPLRELFGEGATEVDRDRTWRAIVDRRASHRRNAARRKTALAALASASVLLFVTWLVFGGSTRLDRPLLLADGRPIAVLEDVGTGSETFALSDGSNIVLGPKARLETRESTGHSFAAHLVFGRAEFEVKKRGPRRWSIDCELATVEVVGTQFVLDRDEARLRVEVREGVVLVRSERIAEHERRLGAGESIEILGNSPLENVAPAKVEPAASSSGEGEPPAVSKVASSKPNAEVAPPPWRELAHRGDFKEAFQALGKAGVVAEAQNASAEDLFLLADVARRSGHPADAVAPLTRILANHRSDPRAALAAFTLGRLGLDTLGAPAQAAGWFQQSISLGLSGALVEDARARLVEAQARAGNAAAAKTAADAYEHAYPNGSFLESVRRWSKTP